MPDIGLRLGNRTKKVMPEGSAETACKEERFPFPQRPRERREGGEKKSSEAAAAILQQ